MTEQAKPPHGAPLWPSTVLALDKLRAAAAELDRLKRVNAELVEALQHMAIRFERCIIGGGSDPKYAAMATAAARALIAQHESPTQSSCFVHGDHDGDRCPECAKVLEGG